jgi:hypothetical protein
MGKVDAGHGRHRPGQPTSTQDEGSAMTEGSAPLYRPSEEGEVAVGRIGLILFAAILMIMGGVFQAFTGLVAIFNDQFLIPTREYLFQFDRTSWGWIHLVLGVVIAGAGAGLLAGRTWGQVVATRWRCAAPWSCSRSCPSTRCGR